MPSRETSIVSTCKKKIPISDNKIKKILTDEIGHERSYDANNENGSCEVRQWKNGKTDELRDSMQEAVAKEQDSMVMKKQLTPCSKGQEEMDEKNGYMNLDDENELCDSMQEVVAKEQDSTVMKKQPILCSKGQEEMDENNGYMNSTLNHTPMIQISLN
ncbi:9202_t:CDS:2, partial [Acaulospora morrowiae]